MKRGISIILLGLGVAMMMVHSFVPHHHHSGEVCFVERVQGCCRHSNGSLHRHNNSSHSHSHSPTCNLLNDLAHAEKSRLIQPLQGISNFNILKDFFTNLSRWISLTVKLELSQAIFLSDTFKHWQTPIISSHSFRAPPF